MDRIKIFLTNLGKFNEGVLMGEWVKLPVDDGELEAVMKRIGIRNGYEEYFITDYESSIANLQISEFTSVNEANELARKLEELTDWDYEKLSAVLEAEDPSSVAGILALIQELDDFDLIPEIEDESDLGEYYAEECCILNGLPEVIQRYFDFTAYGITINAWRIHMLRPLKQSEFEKYVHFAYDLALDLRKSSYLTYCDGIKTKTDFIEQARRAFDRKNEEILLFEYDRVVEGWIHYYAMPEDRYVSFFIFNIRTHADVAVDEVIEYLARRYHGCRLYFEVSDENEAVITHLTALRFFREEEHFFDVFHLNSYQSSAPVKGVVRITRKNYTALAGLYEAPDDDMYWKNLRLLAALENWNIYLLYENGSAVGAIYFGYVDDSVMEIFGTDYVHNRFSSEVFRKLLTHAMKEGKKAGMKHLVYFTGENEHPVAVQMGFRLVSRCELYSRDI